MTLAANDTAHRTFSSLFVQTEFLPELGALIAHRPADSRNKTELFAAHISTVEGETAGSHVEFETDGANFSVEIDRSKILNAWKQMSRFPVASELCWIRSSVCAEELKIEPYSREVVAFITLVGQSREEVISLIHRYREFRSVGRAFELASAHADVMLRQLAITREDADLYQTACRTNPIFRIAPCVQDPQCWNGIKGLRRLYGTLEFQEIYRSVWSALKKKTIYRLFAKFFKLTNTGV